MGGSTNWKIAHQFAHLGVISVKPKVGVGNGSSYGYAHHMRQIEKYVCCAVTEGQTLTDVLERFSKAELRCPLRRQKFELLGSPTRFESANSLYLWDRDDNIRDRKHYYTFLKTARDGAVFKIFLDECDPTLWREERIGEPHISFPWY